MKAWIEPLEEKYYGTSVTAEHKGSKIHIEINGGYRPISDRQWEQWGYEEDGEVINDLCAGGHYESQLTYRTAEAIVDMLNSLD